MHPSSRFSRTITTLGLAALLVVPLLAMAEPVNQTFAYAIGDTVSLDEPAIGAGHIETPGSTDTYLFEGLQGERVYFQILSGSGGLADMRLTAPDDSVLFNAIGLFDRGPIELPQDGTYALRIAGRLDSTGTYSFRSNRTVDEVFDYVIGDTVSDGVPEEGAGRIETPGSTDTYLLDADAGQRIFFKPLAGSGTLADVRLTAPSGTHLINAVGFFNNGPLDLPETGTYVLRIAGRGSQTGSYSFAVTETVDESFVYVIGDTVSDGVPEAGAGNLETPGSTDSYLFEAGAGQRVFFKPSGSGTLADVRLTAPGGEVIVNSIGLFNFGPIDLPVEGTYVLRIASRTGLTGTYGFRLNQTVDQFFDHALGERVQEDVPAPGAGRLEEPGSTDTYGFQAEAGSSFRFVRESGSVSLARVRLTSPEGDVLIDTLTLADAGPVTLPQTGVYALRIASQNGNAGNYGFLTASALGAPESVTLEPGDGQLLVSWQPPSVDGGMPPNSYVASASPGGASCSTGTLQCTITGLTNGVLHGVRVVASNADLDSYPSPTVFGVPLGPPGPPQALAAIPADGAAHITWQPPSSNGGSEILGYRVSAQPGDFSCEVEDTGCTLDGLSNGTSYDVTVLARNAQGDGPPAGPVSVIPQPDLIDTATELLPAEELVRIGQAASVSARVTAASFPPTDGRVVVSASSGESCTDEGPPTAFADAAVFSCALTFPTPGPRQLQAVFENSATHLGSISEVANWTAVRFADLWVDIDDGQTHSTPAQEVAYLVTVGNAGPDMAPGSRVSVIVDPALQDPDWTCQETGGAACPAAAGNGGIDYLIDMPAEGVLEFVLNGRLADLLPATVIAAAEVQPDADKPNWVVDPAPSNNQDIDENVVEEIFADGFETR